jgi:predicted nucleic acid-binding OB-fold protein
MKRYENLYYNTIYKKKYILLLDNNNSGRKTSYNSIENNIKSKEIVDREILKKNIIKYYEFNLKMKYYILIAKRNLE